MAFLECSRWIKRNWTTAQVGEIVSSPLQRWDGASYDPTTCTPLNTSMLLGMYSLAIIGAAISPTRRPVLTSINTWRPAYQQSRVYPAQKTSPIFLDGQRRSGRSASYVHILGGSNFMPRCLAILRNFWANTVHEVCTQTSGLRWMFQQRLFNYKIHCQLYWVVVSNVVYFDPYLEKWSNLTICSNGFKPPTSLSLTHFASQKHLRGSYWWLKLF